MTEAAAIFSPSVARIAASTARDWSYVDSWLASRLAAAGRTVPPFERNAETLRALLALAAANEAADEDRQLLARADAAALDELRQRARRCARRDSSPPPRRLTSHLAAAIDHELPTEGRNALECLARIAVGAGVAFPEPRDLGRSIACLQASLMALQHMVARVESLGRHIQREADQAAETLSLLQGSCYRPPSDAARLNLDLQRKTKAAARLLAAANAASSVHAPRPNIDDVSRQEYDLVALLRRNKELDVQMAAFEGLSSDPDVARRELDALRCHLRDLTLRRDAVFEGLVERESPVKRR